jgi:hypothetical protein
VTGARGSSPPRWEAAGGAAAILLCVALAYLPTLGAGFLWDDDSMLVNNIVLQDHGLFRAWFSTQQLNWWPVTSTSYWLEHWLWGLNPAGYHATNLLIHAGCAFLIWRILRRLRVPAALPCALLFAVHPVNVESVAWIAQRKTILSLLFFLLALLAYLAFDASGRRRLYAGSVACFALALLSKGAVVALPLVILLCLWWLRGAVRRRDLLRSLPFFALAGVMSAVEIWFQYTRVIGANTVREEGLLSRLAGAGSVVWFYLGKALMPMGLSFVYPRWHIDPAHWLAWLPDLALAAALWLAWRARTGAGRPVLFALAYTVLMLLPVLGFFDIYFMRYSLVADHYQYGSMIGVVALATAAARRLLLGPVPTTGGGEPDHGRPEHPRGGPSPE